MKPRKRKPSAKRGNYFRLSLLVRVYADSAKELRAAKSRAQRDWLVGSGITSAGPFGSFSMTVVRAVSAKGER